MDLIVVILLLLLLLAATVNIFLLSQQLPRLCCSNNFSILESFHLDVCPLAALLSLYFLLENWPENWVPWKMHFAPRGQKAKDLAFLSRPLILVLAVLRDFHKINMSGGRLSLLSPSSLFLSTQTVGWLVG